VGFKVATLVEQPRPLPDGRFGFLVHEEPFVPSAPPSFVGIAPGFRWGAVTDSGNAAEPQRTPPSSGERLFTAFRSGLE
jgi:hypothetical protein